MGRIEKTVFISYRRANLPWALNIYQYLTHHGFDVFIDYQSIGSGDFERTIIENIKYRAHFLAVLTPSALERLNQPSDWLRREIETAMDEKRNIVPIMLEGFDFGSPKTVEALDGKLEKLSRYNGLKIPDEYFLEAMGRLLENYLSIPVDAVLQPLSDPIEKITEEQKDEASKAPPVAENELTAQSWFERGYIAAENNNLDEAIRLLEKVLEISPESVIAHSNLGALFLKQGRHDEAEKAILNAIKIDPEFAKAYYNLGILRVEQNEPDKAEPAYKKSIDLDPNYAPTFYNLGNLELRRNQYDLAEDYYKKAIEIDPKFSLAHANLGNILLGKEQVTDAENAFRTAIIYNPNDVKALSNLGYLLVSQDRNDEAENLLRKAIVINPNYLVARYNLGALLEKLKRYDEAEAVFLKWIELYPKVVESQNSFGIMFLGPQGMYESKFTPHDENSIAPYYVATYYSLACLKSLSGHIDIGFEYLEEAISKGQDKAWAWSDPDLELLRKDKRFEEIVGPNPK